MDLNKDGTIVYPSVEAALDDLRELLPLFQLARMDPGAERALREQALEMIDLFESGKLEALIRKQARPDGTVQFRFAPDALKLLKDALPHRQSR
jgi:hypothetical protein